MKQKRKFLIASLLKKQNYNLIMDSDNLISITAPAKLNLFLHITGKRNNGYHDLQSLVTFADFGDQITITPAEEFMFSFDSTSDNFPIDENNIIICAANLLGELLHKDLNCHIHLTKNIPIGAGLGGGSSDAAATIEGLSKFWNADILQDQLDKILIELGADVPACFYKKACYFEGIGEIIKPISALPTLHAVIIYPNKHCSTKEIFESYVPEFSENILLLPEKFETEQDFLDFLHLQKNDLTNAAIEKIPDIKDIIDTLEKDNDCLLTRMSGSGSACFGLFDNRESAHDTAHKIKHKNPEWWVQATALQ